MISDFLRDDYSIKLRDVDKFKKMVAPIIESYNTPAGKFGNIKANTLENINWLLEKKIAALAADFTSTNLQAQIKYMQEKMTVKQ